LHFNCASAGFRPLLLHDPRALVRDRPVREVHLTRQHVREGGLGLWNHREGNSVDFRTPEEVTLKRLQRYGAPVIPRNRAVWATADEHPRVAEVGVIQES